MTERWAAQHSVPEVKGALGLVPCSRVNPHGPACESLQTPVHPLYMVNAEFTLLPFQFTARILITQILYQIHPSFIGSLSLLGRSLRCFYKLQNL